MSRTSTRYKTCIKISSKLFNFLFCIQEVVRISCNMAIKIQQVILHALQIGFCIKCVAHMDDDLQVRMQVPLSMHKASLVLPTINHMHDR